MALALLCPVCNWQVGTIEVHLVQPSESNRNPFDGVVTLRIRIEAEGMSPRETSVYVRDGKGGTLGDVPVGEDRILTVEGLNGAGGVVSRGVSAPFDTREGTTGIYLYFCQVDRFSGPPAVGASGFNDRFRTKLSSESRVFHATAALDAGALVTGGVVAPPVDFLGRITGGDSASGTAEVFDATAAAFEEESLALTPDRVHHSAAPCPGSDLVLIIGGGHPDAMGTAALYKQSTGRIEPGVSLNEPRSRHGTAVVTGERDGIVVAGGSQATLDDVLPWIEIFEQGTFEDLGTRLEVERTGCRAVPCPGGVLVVGGWQGDGNGGLEPSALVDRIGFDGTRSHFDMQSARAEHTAVLVGPGDDPRLFVCGGLGDPDDDGVLEVLATCELIDFLADPPVFDVDVDVGRWAHTATVLPDGSVLVAGGFNSVDPAGPTGGPAHQHATLFYDLLDRINKFPRTIPMVAGRAGHTATLLSNGMVVFIGGISKYDLTGEDPQPVMPDQDYEIFNPG